MRSYSQTRTGKILLWFFALLFAAILIHPDWDLLDVHDVRITSVRQQAQTAAKRPIQPLPISFARPRIEPPFLLEWLQSSALDQDYSTDQPPLNVLRI